MELVERDEITADLDHHLAAAAAGQGRLVMLAGEAGAGKTALLRRFAADRAGQIQLLVGACDPLSTPRPLGPLLDVAAGLGPEVQRLLAENARREHLFQAVLAAITTAPSRPPVLLLVEDIHWADEATLDLLRFLGRRIEPTAALVVATYRSDEAGPSHPVRHLLGDLATAAAVHRATLRPLSPAAVAHLAAGSKLDPLSLHRRTGGNPFFVTETLASGGTGIPPTVGDAVLVRVARLPAAAHALLEAIAVFGGPVAAEMLHAVLPNGTDAVELCLASGILTTTERELAFRHELAREAVLATIPPTRRLALHARALAALAALPADARDQARLAHHAEEAGDRAAVLRHAPAAARRAAALRAHREAAAQFARALRFADALPPAEQADLLEARSYECYLTAQIDAAIAARRAALAIRLQLGDARKAGENRCRLAILHWAESRIEDAEREAVAAVATLEALPPGPELALAYGALARLRATTLDVPSAIALGERAITLAARHGAHQILAGALITVGVTRHAEGDDHGRQQLEQAIALASANGFTTLVARATYDLGVGYGEQYRFAPAIPHLEASIAYCEQHDLDHARLYATSWLAYAHYFQGRWDTAARLAADVLDTAAVSPVTRFTALYVQGMIRVRRGDTSADPAPTLDEALALAQGSGSLARLGPIRAARAEAAWTRGDHQRTIAEARAVYDLALDRRQRWYLGELAYWRWRAGDLATPPPAAAEPFAFQIAGDWAAAAAAWDDLGCPYEAARARLESTDEAALRHALATFERLAAGPAIARTRQRLRAIGARAIPRGPRPSTRANPARLTRRETEVLALLAANASTQAIASHLFLSPRTVENHVASILAKLGVASRGAAAREAARLGLLPQTE